MSADLLRRAAKTLRDHVAELPRRAQGSWIQDSSEIYREDTGSLVGTMVHVEGAEIAYYTILMHPPVALALAEHLDDFADSLDQDGGVVMDSGTDGAITIARAILREQP